MKLIKADIAADGERLACEYALKDKNAVILHGAGTSEMTRFYPIAGELAKYGIGVILFDFSGHGQSSGKLSEQSLEKRRIQARAVIDKIVPKGELYLLGFSMGAQTLCDILPTYQDRVRAVLLGCPAIYSEKARNIDFGNNEFTSILRSKNSWKNSTAPGFLKSFSGYTVIAIGGQDEVIPQGVVNLLKIAARKPVYKEYGGVTHQLVKWLSENPKELSKLVESFA